MKTYKIIYLYSCFLSSRISENGISADFIQDHISECCSDVVYETADKWEAVRVFAEKYNTGSIDNTVIDYETGEDCTAVELFQLLENDGLLLTSDF